MQVISADAWTENWNSVHGTEATTPAENKSDSLDVEQKPIADLTVRLEREKPIWKTAREMILEYMGTVPF